MADRHGLFWNSINDDRTYDADSFSEWLDHFFTTGVFKDELQVTAAGGMKISVAKGYANIKGKVRFFDQPDVLTLQPAGSAYPRIDTVVVERNDTDREITVKVVTGAYASTDSVPVEPVRSAAVYQIVLAQIYVAAGTTEITQADITDTRADSDLCGIVAGTVKELDFGQFTAQFDAYFRTFKTVTQADVEDWLKTIKQKISGTDAGKLQLEIDEVAAKLESRVKTITLEASKWSAETYTISDALITATSNQEILPPVDVSADQLKVLTAAQLVDAGQSAGQMKIRALGKVPAADVQVRVLFRGSK